MLQGAGLCPAGAALCPGAGRLRCPGVRERLRPVLLPAGPGPAGSPFRPAPTAPIAPGDAEHAPARAPGSRYF